MFPVPASYRRIFKYPTAFSAVVTGHVPGTAIGRLWPGCDVRSVGRGGAWRAGNWHHDGMALVGSVVDGKEKKIRRRRKKIPNPDSTRA